MSVFTNVIIGVSLCIQRKDTHQRALTAQTRLEVLKEKERKGGKEGRKEGERKEGRNKKVG